VDTTTTTIKPLTRDEMTWHPNDSRGVRSHVVADDFKVRGAARMDPTPATIYLHFTRINPKFSAYKLGTFVHQLSEAFDLNTGRFSGKYQIRERRSSFYRNAWRDSLGFPVLEMAGDIEIKDYKVAKESGYINDDYRDQFPILKEESTEDQP